MSDTPKRFPHGGPCRHFNGIQNDACRAGVSFDTLPRAEHDGNSRLPCVRLVDGKRWCDKYDPFTPDEMQEQENGMMESTGHVVNALHGIAEAKKRGETSIVCPKCLGVLRFAHASNGHVRARCETADCMVFMS